jgi:hypothetical protein
LAREFGVEVNTVSVKQNEYVIMFKGYNTFISTDLINELKAKSPYSVDRFLLQKFRNQGVSFSERRSQYLKCCLL